MVSLLPGFPHPDLCSSPSSERSFYNVPVHVSLLPGILYCLHVTDKPEFKLLNMIPKALHALTPGASLAP